LIFSKPPLDGRLTMPHDQEPNEPLPTIEVTEERAPLLPPKRKKLAAREFERLSDQRDELLWPEPDES
jgi:hypothetical protein